MYRAYYRPSYNISSQVSRNRKPKQRSEDVVITAETVWGAAAYADRINDGEYRKEPEYEVRADGTLTPNVVRHANRFHMWEAINDVSRITDEDRSTGKKSRDIVRKGLVLKALKGPLGDFEQALTAVVEMSEFNTGGDRYEIALVTSQIRAAREIERIESVMTDVNPAPVADVGSKIECCVTVVKCVYSNNFNVYFVTAKTDSNQIVFFSYRERQAIGNTLNIRGTVKAHRPDATQLNRVRIQ